MRKPIALRIFALLLLYCAVFVVLVLVQFTKRGNFTQRIGPMVISGQYRQLEEGEDAAANPGEYLLSGGASVYFGGLEFILKTRDNDDSFTLVNAGGEQEKTLPEGMVLSEDTAKFLLPGGSGLSFTAGRAGGIPEIQIDGDFAEGFSGLEIPFRPQRSARIRETSDGRLNIYHDGFNYSFSRSVRGEGKGLLSLKAGSSLVSYRAIPEKKSFSPEDYIVEQARSPQAFNDALAKWRDQSFSLWARLVSTRNDEDTVIAYVGEAARRGSYKAAVAAASAALLSGGQRSYESSVYLGGMDTGLRSFTAAEREKIGRLSRLINEKSLEFLNERHVFEFFAVRGLINFIDDGAALIRSIDPASLSPDLIPAIFEGFEDLRQWRPYGDNPFERLLDQACYVLSEGVCRDEDRVLVFRGGNADLEFNLRLGEALRLWAEGSGHDEWAALGRSILLSVFSLGDSTGSVPQTLTLSDAGTFSEAPGARPGAARLYRIFGSGEYRPRATAIGSGVNGIWAWTAASVVSAAQDNNVLDISVSFPMGETHYMMIRGVRPFAKIQLYNIDYRTDIQFERYDSSGWVYSAQEQILVLKMKHRVAVEHIRIFY
ncbi:MAG: hypothetical protein LBJ90_07385 [Treponema sp.]|jgi:hypothetical protein|nr:hypothetical protein [Treponema sp.]